MYPHRIRLRGPWETVDPSGQKRRVKLPDDWTTFLGSCVYPQPLTRRFGLPRLIDVDESVFVVCRFDGASGAGLNGKPLMPELNTTAIDHVEYEVTRLLQPRNELEMYWPSKSTVAPEVALEIRGPVFLRDVVNTTVGWAGQVVGENRRNMEVHLLAQGRAVARVPVQANQSFAILRPNELPEGSYNPQAPPWTIELIEMANRWYSIDVQTM